VWVELRDVLHGTWLLEVVTRRGGERTAVFGEWVTAPADRALEVAAARLALAGYQVVGWNEVDGGWDGELGATV
jgi:hypothetical protein